MEKEHIRIKIQTRIDRANKKIDQYLLSKDMLGLRHFEYFLGEKNALEFALDLLYPERLIDYVLESEIEKE